MSYCSETVFLFAYGYLDLDPNNHFVELDLYLKMLHMYTTNCLH